MTGIELVDIGRKLSTPLKSKNLAIVAFKADSLQLATDTELAHHYIQ